MGNLNTFTHVSVDGFFAGPRGDAGWFKAVRRTDDYQEFTHGQAEAGDTLVFGRMTYDMMKSWWPTPQAIETDPLMARVVDESPKIVFSKTLRRPAEEPHWRNVTVVHDIDRKTVEKRKEDAAGPLTVLGSGSVVQQLANLGLIDELGLMVVPVVLGGGKPLFDDVKRTDLELLESRTFENGLTFMRFAPKGGA